MEFYEAWDYAEPPRPTPPASMEFYEAWNYAESQEATAEKEQVPGVAHGKSEEKVDLAEGKVDLDAEEKVDLEAQGVKKVFLAKCWQQ